MVLKYAESVRLMRSMGGASNSTQAMTGGSIVADIAAEVTDIYEADGPPESPYIVPTEEETKPFKRAFVKGGPVAAKLQILIKNEMFAKL